MTTTFLLLASAAVLFAFAAFGAPTFEASVVAALLASFVTVSALLLADEQRRKEP